ncbi:MAG: FkbM family methyltransferase [Candidatus Hodarchaeota archaeon]
MIKRILPDGNIYYYPKNHYGFDAEKIDILIDEIYNPNNPHYYEKYYNLEKGMIVVDAGAYTGLFTLKASKIIGPSGLVFALEPFKPSYNILKYNITKNKCTNVVLLNKGLGNKEGWYKLIVRNKYIGASILKYSKNNLKNIFLYLYLFYLSLKNQIIFSNVKLTTIDNMMIKYNLKKIDFLKLDVEGYETEVLKAYNKINKKNILVLETHNNLEKILYILLNKGYKMNNTYIIPINNLYSIVHTKL